jgi:serine/threonine-protein phosphatase 2A regulatory subunit A
VHVFPLSADNALYPIALLVEEMKSEDTEVRINAMRQLRKIAAALGADRTRKELIPFLNGESHQKD